MKKQNYIKTAVLFGILIFLAALIGQRTAHGYIHPADPLILLAGYILPIPYALISVGAASLLADLAKGYLLLAPVTLLIKLIMVLAVKGLLRTRPAKKFPELIVSIAALIPVPTYYLAELTNQFFNGKKITSFAIASVTLRKDLIQAIASVLLFIFLYDIKKGIDAGRKEVQRLKEAEKKQQEDQSE